MNAEKLRTEYGLTEEQIKVVLLVLFELEKTSADA